MIKASADERIVDDSIKCSILNTAGACVNWFFFIFPFR